MARKFSATVGQPRRAFTVLELLVVIAVIAVVAALVMVAVQRARELASRAQCANNLRQLALAAQNYLSAQGQFPAGAVKHKHFDADGRLLENDRYTWCLLLLPYLERNDLYSRWVFKYNGPSGKPGVRSTGFFTLPDTGDLATGAVAAQPVTTFLCPTDPAIATTSPYGVIQDLLSNVTNNGANATWSPTAGFQPLPAGDPGYWEWGMTSYQGNGGTASYGVLKLYAGGLNNANGNNSGQNESRDGTIYLWQYADNPKGTNFYDLRYTVDVAAVRDGTSNTFLIGEKSLFDPSWTANCAAGFQNLLINQSYWGSPTGVCVYAGTEFPLNSTYAKLAAQMSGGCYTAGDTNSCACEARVTNFSSNHSGGVNFAFCDGSVRFIADKIALTTLQALSTRAGGETVDATTY